MNYSSWNDFYKQHTPDTSNLVLHSEYLLKILLANPQSILEIGCGPATHSLFVKKLRPHISLSLLDLDAELLNDVFSTHKGQIDNIYHYDILNKDQVQSLPHFDLIISQGLLEHFNNQDFLTIIENFKSVSKQMLFDIPSSNYPTQDFGNEILRSREEVLTLLSRGNGYSFSVKDMFDPGIRTKQLAIKKQNLHGISSLKLMIFGSCHLLGHIAYEHSV